MRRKWLEYDISYNVYVHYRVSRRKMLRNVEIRERCGVVGVAEKMREASLILFGHVESSGEAGQCGWSCSALNIEHRNCIRKCESKRTTFL